MFWGLDQYSLFGIQLINFNNFGLLLLKLGTDICFTFIIIRLIFYPIYKERNYLFTSFLINITVFLICFLLANIKLKIGFAFGLFAVFSIIRYRTEPIPIRQMTYMFTVIIVAVLNALSDETISYAELILANVVILLTILIMEKNLLHNRDMVKVVKYEKIELIKPENYDKLIQDLKDRTGFNIIKAEIESINFLNDTTKLKIYYQYPNNFSVRKDK
jgi:hypothetical protein